MAVGDLIGRAPCTCCAGLVLMKEGKTGGASGTCGTCGTQVFARSPKAAQELAKRCAEHAAQSSPPSQAPAPAKVKRGLLDEL